ncbi:MAG: hypothetical protein ACRC2T_05190 [Thermoguttaceae bacterium]
MTEYNYFSNVCPIETMRGENNDETLELIKMLKAARDFITSHKWCPEIKYEYFGGGIGGIIAVFLFQFSSSINDQDEWLWVIEGDVPPAYLVVDSANNPCKALDLYCSTMESWSHCVLSGSSTDNEFPVKALPSAENANMLLNRVNFLRKEVIPWLQAEQS